VSAAESSKPSFAPCMAPPAGGGKRRKGPRGDICAHAVGDSRLRRRAAHRVAACWSGKLRADRRQRNRAIRAGFRGAEAFTLERHCILKRPSRAASPSPLPTFADFIGKSRGRVFRAAWIGPCDDRHEKEEEEQ
jgi:hypothetical protein